MSLAAGTRIGPYEILDLAGAGGMGEVYRARDTRLGRTVALKFVLEQAGDDPVSRDRFEQEARAVAALDHPHICAIHDVGRHEGRDFLVMEFLEGESLQQRLRRGPLPPVELLKVATAVADALAAAHREGIIHRDLKPSNVMLARTGAKLVDFGIARRRPLVTGRGPVSEAEITTVLGTADGTLVGTIPYMAPEQLEGKPVDARTDIFAFGALLYEMATGRRAFDGGSSAAQIAAILSDSRPHLPEGGPFPPLLGRIVSGCLPRDPDERWQNASDVLRALRWSADGGVDAQGTRASPRTRRWPVHAAWAAALVTTAVLVWTASRWAGSPEPPRNPQPVIVLMDSPLPGRVYDPGTAAAGGTNADDVTDALRDLPVVIRKENTSSLWHREEQVVAENPDLIVTHLSCLYDSRVAGDEAVNEHIWVQAENRLLMFLAYVAARNPRTRFIVYSRSRFIEKGGEEAWVRDEEARLPVLRGRLSAFTVPGQLGKPPTFRDPATARLLKTRVTQALNLPGN